MPPILPARSPWLRRQIGVPAVFASIAAAGQLAMGAYMLLNKEMT